MSGESDSWLAFARFDNSEGTLTAAAATAVETVARERNPRRLRETAGASAVPDSSTALGSVALAWTAAAGNSLLSSLLFIVIPFDS